MLNITFLLKVGDVYQRWVLLIEFPIFDIPIVSHKERNIGLLDKYKYQTSIYRTGAQDFWYYDSFWTK
jgi:hypothetical protein